MKLIQTTVSQVISFDLLRQPLSRKVKQILEKAQRQPMAAITPVPSHS